MSRGLIVSINGVTQGTGDFVTKGHSVTFARPLYVGDSIELKTITKGGVNTSVYISDGIQTTFTLPAYLREKFAVVTGTTNPVPEGYTVVDVDTEIDLWIRDNCPISDWKWADQLDGALIPGGGFNMSRMIVKDSIVTYIATRWS